MLCTINKLAMQVTAENIVKSFKSLDIPAFDCKISEGEYDKWHRIFTHLNVFGPYGYLVQDKCFIPGNSEIFFKRYSKDGKITVPDKLIQHFIYGKTLFVSGFLGENMDHFDVQLCCDDTSVIKKLINEFNLCIYELNNKYYLSINLDIKTFVWNILKKFTYKLKKLTGYEIGMRGKPAYTKKKIIDGEEFYSMHYDSNLMELDRSLLSDSVFEKFMKRCKTPISKLVDFVSDVPDNFEALDFDEFAANYSHDSVELLWSDDEPIGGQTIKPLINTQPERTLEKVEPCSRPEGGDTSDEALAESEHTSLYNPLVESASSEALSAEEPAAPSRPAVLSALDENSSSYNNGFIVCPPPQRQIFVEQLTFIYKSGTNYTDKFCYMECMEGIKKPKLRKRYMTEQKFVSYAVTIINSCLFSKEQNVSVNFIKRNLIKSNIKIKWEIHDFYYVQRILLDIGIIRCLSNSYKVGSYGKSYEFVKGSLSRFCSEAMSYEFPAENFKIGLEKIE